MVLYAYKYISTHPIALSRLLLDRLVFGHGWNL